ncbi:hypothetical protein GQ457_03G037580 [Hibiscus cannabinus]
MRMEELGDKLGFEKGELGIETEEARSTKLNELQILDLPVMKSGNDVVELLLKFKSIREAIKDAAEAIKEGNVIAERGLPRVYSEQEVLKMHIKVWVKFSYTVRVKEIYTILL